MTVAHAGFTGAELHVPAYFQSSDPGAVGAGIVWIDTTTPTSPAMKVRNAANDGWDLITGSAASGNYIALPAVPAGRYIGLGRKVPLTIGSAAVGAANTLYGCPIPVRAGEIITAVSFTVNSGATGNVRAGVYDYDPTTGFGSTRRATSAGQAVGAGTNDCTLSYTVPTNGYLVGALVFDGTPTVATLATSGAGVRGNTTPAAVGTAGMSRSFTYAQPPDPFGGAVEVGTLVHITFKV
jgi:hypothetical protein